MHTAFLAATANLTDGQFICLMVLLVGIALVGTVVIAKAAARTVRAFHRAGLVRVDRARREGWL